MKVTLGIMVAALAITQAAANCSEYVGVSIDDKPQSTAAHGTNAIPEMHCRQPMPVQRRRQPSGALFRKQRARLCKRSFQTLPRRRLQSDTVTKVRGQDWRAVLPVLWFRPGRR
ncbi:hypothetical protein BDY17DRAFT_171831 [Neohortaea acidophila]|uniref:Uncharacterized protein n=1 Tax=Neohortaea acidophila TaxID=245834 RepID=A0A6A6PP70_9PEZI|nr:uncharacterized protein BDY17DRAFT_171831 [Neohortaea acidophila]KAF2481812.1 hypothetical protein BDY17DRAFT_171831 [Neohortaea acidophila]